MKIMRLASVGLAWAILSCALKAEPMKIRLAQSPTFPPPSRPIPPSRRPAVPLNKYLFDPLGGRVRFPATTEQVAAADRAFQSIWKQANALDKDSPQVLNLIQSLAPIQQQYQASEERWGELKILEVSLKLHYLICQDRQMLEIAKEGVAMAAATGDSTVKKDWSNILAEIYWAMGEEELAIETKQQLLNNLRTPEGNLTFFEAYDLIELGNLYRLIGRYDDAIAAYIEAFDSAYHPPVKRSLDVYFAAGYTFREAASEELISLYKTLGNASQVKYWTQRQEQAKQVYEQLGRASNLLWGRLIEYGVENIPPAQKKPMVEEALQIYRQFGDPWGESDALVALSEVNLALQDYSQAISTGEAALEMIKTLRDSRSQESLIQTLVRAYLAVGQDERAQVIKRDYEQFLATQSFSRRSRPRFTYTFSSSASDEMLPILHRQRSCFEEQ